MKFSTQLLLPSILALAPSASAASPTDLQAQIGHHVIYSYPGLEPPAQLLDLIAEGKVGGIIIFGENVGDNLTTTIDNFQNTYMQSPYYSGSPLFIMTDQEGGKVRRLPGGPVESAKQIGQAADPEAAATQMGKDAASTLATYKNLYWMFIAKPETSPMPPSAHSATHPASLEHAGRHLSARSSRPVSSLPLSTSLALVQQVQARIRICSPLPLT
jgi:hypothetical protein